MPTELIKNRIESLTPEYRDFVMSDFSDAIAANIATTHQLDSDTETALANMIFLYTTLILSEYELTEALVSDCGININHALSITKTIIASIPKEMSDALASTYAELVKSENLVDEKTRRDIITNQTEQKKLAFLYVRTNPYLRNLFITKNLDEEKVDAGLLLIGDIILGFYKIEDTVPLLQQELNLDPKTAALLGAEVLEFLAPLSDPNWQPLEDEDEISENIPAPEAAISRIPIKAPAPLHTFASDMAIARNEQPVEVNTPVYATAPTYQAAPEPVYQSTQPNPVSPVLSSIPSYTTPNTPTPAPVPPPPAPDRPRWSTDI